VKATLLTILIFLILRLDVHAQPTTSPATAPGSSSAPSPSIPTAPVPGSQNAPQVVQPQAPASQVPPPPAPKKDLTDKLSMFKDLRVVFPINKGVDTRWQHIGDYSFVADIEFNNATGYSYKWHMTPPARGEGIRATEIHDVNTSRKVSLFYPEHQNCTLVGYTNILRVSDAVFNALKRGEVSDFELDGPDTPLKYNREVFPLPHSIRPVNIEPAELFVNDHLVSVRTIRAETDNHWHYWILDNPNFPLLVRGHGPFLWNLVQLRHPKLDGLLKDDKVDPDSEARRIIKSLEDTGEATTRAILFDFDKSVIRTVSKPILNKLAVYLEQHPKLRLGVEGHTDIIGGMTYNIKLSQRRANAVKTYLVNLGIAPARLKPSGFGYTKPVADNSTAMGRQLNRRVVFRKL
jgi:outer membrane protein OmpA-like peptidoglycan-associated protein